MENALSEIRNGKMNVNAELVDVLFQCLDALETYLDNIVESQDEGTEDNEPIIARLNVFLNGGGGEAPAPKKEEKEASKPEGSTQAKEVKLNEYESKAVNEAFNKNLNVYSLEVHVDENCILKAARAFLVFKAVEELGEIIKSDPSAQDIEDERFELEFTIVVITEKEMETVKKAVENVSEIRQVLATKITNVPKTGEAEETSVAKKADSSAVAVADKSSAPAAASKSGATTKSSSKPVVNRSVRVDIEKLDVLMNLVSELIIAKNGLMSVSSNEEGMVSAAFNEQVEYLERVTTNLHESVMKVRMMPIETVTQKFPKMVRDLSKKLDKQMKLFITGEDTELDRTVIDEIGDPLMHLIRNSADHGLEDGETRAQRGKDPVGNIYLDAYQDGNNVVIEVRDDGNGIDVEKIRSKAVERGAVTPEQAELLTDKEVIDFLFQPSFSTAKQVTDVSGRGVGLDVVKTKIESLGGDIEVKTMLGEGSTFIIRLPLTLAIIQSLMVEVGGEKYAISLGSIQTIEDVLVTDIKYVQSKEVINLRGTVIPLIRLDSILDIEPSQENVESLTAVIVKKGDRLAGLIVDSLIGQQEIVIKSLGKYMSNNSKIISGATILGDGEVALILDANALV
jgi:two-component system chemotaxis sensor kinase CheA